MTFETDSKSKLVNSKSADALYRSFLQRFLELAVRRQRPILVREVDHSLGLIQAHGAPIHNEQNEPFRIISVDCDGNVSTFSPELLGMEHERYGSFCFGNVVHHSFEEIAARVHESRLYADITAGVRQCASTCAYYGLCGGGAPSNKIFENGSAATTETVHCRAFMRSVDVVLDLIERLPPDLYAARAASQSHVGAPAPGMWPG